MLLPFASDAQQPSPAIPRSPPLVGLDGFTALGAIQVKPVADGKGGAGPGETAKTKSIDPPRQAVDPKVLR